MGSAGPGYSFAQNADRVLPSVSVTVGYMLRWVEGGPPGPPLALALPPAPAPAPAPAPPAVLSFTAARQQPPLRPPQHASTSVANDLAASRMGL